MKYEQTCFVVGQKENVSLIHPVMLYVKIISFFYCLVLDIRPILI